MGNTINETNKYEYIVMIKYVDWNLISYADAWKQQQEVFDAIQSENKAAVVSSDSKQGAKSAIDAVSALSKLLKK